MISLGWPTFKGKQGGCACVRLKQCTMTWNKVFVFLETTPYKFCIKEKYSTGGLLSVVIYQFCPNVRMSEEFRHVSWFP